MNRKRGMYRLCRSYVTAVVLVGLSSCPSAWGWESSEYGYGSGQTYVPYHYTPPKLPVASVDSFIKSWLRSPPLDAAGTASALVITSLDGGRSHLASGTLLSIRVKVYDRWSSAHEVEFRMNRPVAFGQTGYSGNVPCTVWYSIGRDDWLIADWGVATITIDVRYSNISARVLDFTCAHVEPRAAQHQEAVPNERITHSPRPEPGTRSMTPRLLTQPELAKEGAPTGLASGSDSPCQWSVDGAIMVRIPAGSFTMGTPLGVGESDEDPQHTIYLDEYYVDKYEVTNRQYRQFCEETQHEQPKDPGFAGLPDYFVECPDYPVVNVTWNDAVAYCEWAGKRLPTEAEWEKAARGSDVRKYPWGSEEPDATRANFTGQNGRTTKVGSYPEGASPCGVLDMAGNVWEWCSDRYDRGYYAHSQRDNPAGSESGSLRVTRGGSWDCTPNYLRCAYRLGCDPSVRNNALGFRCVVGGNRR